MEVRKTLFVMFFFHMHLCEFVHNVNLFIMSNYFILFLILKRGGQVNTITAVGVGDNKSNVFKLL